MDRHPLFAGNDRHSGSILLVGDRDVGSCRLGTDYQLGGGVCRDRSGAVPESGKIKISPLTVARLGGQMKKLTYIIAETEGFGNGKSADVCGFEHRIGGMAFESSM